MKTRKSEVKYCKKCGKELPFGTKKKYCEHCVNLKVDKIKKVGEVGMKALGLGVTTLGIAVTVGKKIKDSFDL